MAKEASIEGYGRRKKEKTHKKEKRKKKSSAEAHGPVRGAIASAQSFTYSKSRDCLLVHVRIAMSRNQARRWRCSIGEAVSPPDYITAPTRCKYFAAERQNSWQRFVSYEYACNATTSRLSIHFIEMQARRKPVMHMRSKVQYR